MLLRAEEQLMKFQSWTDFDLEEKEFELSGPSKWEAFPSPDDNEAIVFSKQTFEWNL